MQEVVEKCAEVDIFTRLMVSLDYKMYARYFNYAVGIFLFICYSNNGRAQDPGTIIDQIAAVVGSNIIMYSDIEMEYKQLQKEYGQELSDTVKCAILRQRILEFVLLNKAQLDSVVVNEDRVDQELERRIRYFAMQFGGEKKMEEFYGKTISQIKEDNREKIRNNLVVNEMQQKALKDVKVSPYDVRKYFNAIPEDSLPYYSAEIEVAQLIIEPKVSEEAKKMAYEKILNLRQRVMNGENFTTLALIYSEDKGSAVNGGELGFFTRGAMVPEFEAAAFKLKPDSVSKIIETKYGYHILKLVDRKGENINVRHILIRPQIFRSDINRAKELLDSIIWLVKIDTLTFEQAAKKYSDDPATRGNGGFISDQQSGTTQIPVDELDKKIYYRIEGMKPGEISEPELITLDGPDRQQAWRVFYFKAEHPPHVANLTDDYQKYQALALQAKQAKALNDYIERAKKATYIRIAPEFRNCPQLAEFLSTP